MIKVGKLNATTTEKYISVDSDLNPTLIITADADCEISINNNTSYQTYKLGEIIPLQDRKGSIDKLFYKTLVGTAIIRYWVY